MAGPSPDMSQESTTATSQSESEGDATSGGSPEKKPHAKNLFNIAARMNLPTIRGGLNGSISDILEASGYGTETDFKIDEDIK